MARSNFGGTDTAAAGITAPSTKGGVWWSAPNISGGTAWSAATGGTQYTDLILPGGGATTVRTDGDGFVRAMQGPDGVNEGMWIDLGTGVRWYLRTTDSLALVYSRLAGGNTITGIQHLANDLYLDNASGGLQVANLPTVAQVRCLQVIPASTAQGSGLTLQAGITMPTTGVKTQILMYGSNDAGNVNYDRVGFSALDVSNFIIDSTYGGTTAPRSITFQMGGSAAAAATTVATPSNGAVLPQATINVASTATFLAAGTIQIGADEIAYTGKTATTFTGCTGGVGTLATGQTVYQLVHGQNGLVVYPDASVDLNGGSKVVDGKTFGATRARVSDPMDTGATQLVIDTRTITGTDNAADSSAVTYARGGVSKWRFGLNYAGGNTDALQAYSQMGAGTVLELAGGATASIGFLGKAPSARRATTANATDLATVITLANALKADLIAFGLKS